MHDIGLKIKEVRLAAQQTRETFAQEVGEKPSKIQDIESGRQRVNDEFLRKLITRFPVDLNWLFGAEGFGGEGGYPRIEPPDPGKPVASHFRADGEEYALIRRMDLSLSAGTGLEPVAEAVAERLAFSRTWLMRHGLTADLCALVRVKGDSMEPTIPDGSLALLNAAERWSTSPGIFAFSRGGQAYIKRVSPTRIGPDGRPLGLAIVSDNPAYPPEVVTGPDLNDYRPVGRVRTVLADV